MWRETITLCLYLLAGVTAEIEIELASTVSVVVGEDANLTVSYSSTSRPHVTWSSGDVFAFWNIGENTSVSVSAEYEDRLMVNTSTASIVIARTRLTDSSLYSVSLSAVGERPTSRNVTLRVYELITDVRVAVPTSDIEEGDPDIVLTCAMNSGTWDLLSWRKDGEMIQGDSRRILAGNELTIRKVIRGDTGSYSCFVQNPFSNGSAQGSLSVYYGPDVPRVTITSPGDPSPESYVLVNSTVTLNCSSASEPEAGYVWSVGESGNTEVPQGAVLTLHHIRLDQAGTYSCIATNPRLSRSVRKSLILNVY
ncbi:V-set and immunoglobulin domain-containing protein 10-like, partial [Hemiscyllium ocellatum]|uniref:V-set and immunoglobulin domain-containing protein 10-like n=1 Tax=Hemiscyllium ocellatum TaxID=170820 RepID=UPI00296612A5